MHIDVAAFLTTWALPVTCGGACGVFFSRARYHAQRAKEYAAHAHEALEVISAATEALAGIAQQLGGPGSRLIRAGSPTLEALIQNDISTWDTRG